MSTIAGAWPAYKALRYRAFSWRVELPVAKKVVLAFGLAALTGIAAQIRVQLPFTPVPVTGQVFAVLLSGVLLGRFYGGLSQALYVGLGAAGLPWFAGDTVGLSALTGVTGGYLVGFVLAAGIIGHVSDRCAAARRFAPQVLLMTLGVGVIYLCGAIWFSVVMHTGLAGTLWGAVLPFVPVDVGKALLAACVSTAVLPKAPRTGELDAPARP